MTAFFVTGREAQEAIHPIGASSEMARFILTDRGQQPVASFLSLIGVQGGGCGSGDISVRVPAGAVSTPTLFSGDIYLSSPSISPTDSKKGEYVLSPLVQLLPSRVAFKKAVQVVLPPTVPLVSAHGCGWLLELKVCEHSGDGNVDMWYTALTYNTMTREVTNLSPWITFDSDTGYLHVDHFCDLHWIGCVLRDMMRGLFVSFVGRSISYVVFGEKRTKHKWKISFHIVHSSVIALQELHKRMRPDHVCLQEARTSHVGKSGQLEARLTCSDPWHCERGSSCQVPADAIWTNKIECASYYDFIVMDHTRASTSLCCSLEVSFSGSDCVDVEPVVIDIDHPLLPREPAGERVYLPCVDSLHILVHFVVWMDG